MGSGNYWSGFDFDSSNDRFSFLLSLSILVHFTHVFLVSLLFLASSLTAVKEGHGPTCSHIVAIFPPNIPPSYPISAFVYWCMCNLPSFSPMCTLLFCYFNYSFADRFFLTLPDLVGALLRKKHQENGD
jgi:hypothetical protein